MAFLSALCMGFMSVLFTTNIGISLLIFVIVYTQERIIEKLNDISTYRNK
jgi:ABC-type methionine transport system permease subunit